MGNSPSAPQASHFVQPRRFVTPDTVVHAGPPSQGRVEAPALPVTVPIEQVTVLRTEYTLQAGSLRLYEREGSYWRVALDFACDCAVPTAVSVYTVAVDLGPQSKLCLPERLCCKYPQPPLTAVLHGVGQRFLPAALGAGEEGDAALSCDTTLYLREELTNTPGRDDPGRLDRALSSGGPVADRLACAGLKASEAGTRIPPEVVPFVITLQAVDGCGRDGSVAPLIAVFVTLRVLGSSERPASAPAMPGWSPSLAFAPTLLRTVAQLPGADGRPAVYEFRSMYGESDGPRERDEGGGEAADDVVRPDCVICIEQPSSHVVMPCGHVCLCSTCAGTMSMQTDKRCPVCRSPMATLLIIPRAGQGLGGGAEPEGGSESEG